MLPRTSTSTAQTPVPQGHKKKRGGRCAFRTGKDTDQSPTEPRPYYLREHSMRPALPQPSHPRGAIPLHPANVTCPAQHHPNLPGDIAPGDAAPGTLHASTLLWKLPFTSATTYLHTSLQPSACHAASALRALHARAASPLLLSQQGLPRTVVPLRTHTCPP